MLFVLTGDIQTGKTRWLCDILDELERMSVTPFGVIAPGIWRDPARGNDLVSVSGGFECPEASLINWDDMPSGAIDDNGFEKVGICNALLPDRDALLFALRRDVAAACGRLDADTQSERARLGWHISDTAISRVDEYFKHPPRNPYEKSLIVVDELGGLELVHGEGLVSAMELLRKGPTPGCPHALVVVRLPLADRAELEFVDIWNGSMCIYPDEDGKGALLGALR